MPPRKPKTQQTPVAVETPQPQPDTTAAVVPNASPAPQPAAPSNVDAILMLAEILRNQNRAVAVDKLYVGIRNISSDFISIPASHGESELALHADFGQGDPQSTAVIAYPRWQAIRSTAGGIYRLGLVRRDDSILGAIHAAAPADTDGDLADRDHAANSVVDPFAFIENSSESALRAAIGTMTSEAVLRRLLGAVDQKIRQLQGPGPFDANDPEAIAHVKAALRALPSAYRFVETLVEDRLEELFPKDRTSRDGA